MVCFLAIWLIISIQMSRVKNQQQETPQQNVAEIKKSIEKIKASIEVGIDKIATYEAKEAVIVIGETGSGKSTLINYLAGAKLTSVKQIKPPRIVIKADQQVGDIQIVSGAVSGTAVPDKFFDEKTGITYFDCPGFGDTRGPEQDIANGFYIKKVFDVAEKIKVVIVIDANSLNSRAHLIQNISDQLHQLFYGAKESKDVDDSFSLMNSESYVSEDFVLMV